jgi:hypothetical protein
MNLDLRLFILQPTEILPLVADFEPTWPNLGPVLPSKTVISGSSYIQRKATAHHGELKTFPTYPVPRNSASGQHRTPGGRRCKPHKPSGIFGGKMCYLGRGSVKRSAPDFISTRFPLSSLQLLSLRVPPRPSRLCGYLLSLTLHHPTPAPERPHRPAASRGNSTCSGIRCTAPASPDESGTHSPPA